LGEVEFEGVGEGFELAEEGVDFVEVVGGEGSGVGVVVLKGWGER